MARYLVVAHQTSASPQLVSRLRAIAAEDAARGADAEFMLLVPATPRAHLAGWTEGESRQIALQVAESARARMERLGLHVCGVAVGDPSPVLAIHDELRAYADYAAVIISTLPPGASRWLKLDVVRRAQRELRMPVIAVMGEPVDPSAAMQPGGDDTVRVGVRASRR